MDAAWLWKQQIHCWAPCSILKQFNGGCKENVFHLQLTVLSCSSAQGKRKLQTPHREMQRQLLLLPFHALIDSTIPYSSKPEVSLFGAQTSLAHKELLCTSCTTVGTAKPTELQSTAAQPSLPPVSSAWIASYSGNQQSLLLVMLRKAGKTVLFSEHSLSRLCRESEDIWCTSQSTQRWPGKSAMTNEI